MRKVQTSSSWVVYQVSTHGKLLGVNVVCGAEEWAEMERARPGQHTLVQGGIATEREAEVVARGTSGDAFRSRSARKP
ncbi:MAG TPA: hypothetical protein VM533_22185 [Fimbriiglobus sp.]|nr:hypothetical protein [Fimbriiglobus sp.]